MSLTSNSLEIRMHRDGGNPRSRREATLEWSIFCRLLLSALLVLVLASSSLPKDDCKEYRRRAVAASGDVARWRQRIRPSSIKSDRMAASLPRDSDGEASESTAPLNAAGEMLLARRLRASSRVMASALSSATASPRTPYRLPPPLSPAVGRLVSADSLCAEPRADANARA